MISTLEMSTLGAISSPGFMGSGVPSRDDIADDGVVALRSDAAFRPPPPLPPGAADTRAGGAVAHPAGTTVVARYRLVPGNGFRKKAHDMGVHMRRAECAILLTRTN